MQLLLRELTFRIIDICGICQYIPNVFLRISIHLLIIIIPGKQSFWDKPGLLTDRALIESSLVEPSQRARFLAAQAPHSGDWLLALPIANCGLCLDDEAVREAMWV